MKIAAKYSKLKHWKTELTCVFLAKNEPNNYWIKELEEIFGDVIQKLISNKEFGCEEKAFYLLLGNKTTKSHRVALIGLDEFETMDAETLRKAAALAIKKARGMEFSKVTFAFPTQLRSKFNDRLIGQSLVEGALLAEYRFLNYKSRPKKEFVFEELTIIADHEPTSLLQEGVKNGVAISEAVKFARDLGNEPGNVLTPTELANRAASMCRQKKIKCQVFNKAKLKSLKMGGILGVSAGSLEEPRLIIMEYKPAKPKNARPIALVGKGLTFDAGGISIKPADQMDRMKFDMCGGAAVIGIMQAAAELKLPYHIIGIVPSSENLLGDAAFKPGDILTMYSGKTVEILNTDAEGRLILADALAYAQKLKPETIIDFATLTGHVVIALGYYAAGLFGTDEATKTKLQASAKTTGEKVWELPVWKEYDDLLKSHIADLKNIGGRYGGASSAAAFLKNFVGETPWIHLDIAGVANTEEASAYCERVSATGFGVRLVIDALQNWSSHA